MNAQAVIAALTATYEAITPKAPTHWPNMAFTPPEAVIWVKPHFKCNEAIAHTNFAEGLDQITGFGQFDINGPIGKGLKAHNAVLERIRYPFRTGTKHTYGDVEVTIVTCGKVDGFESDKYWKEILSFTFRAFVTRDIPEDT